MKWLAVVSALFCSINVYGQVDLKSMDQTKKLIQGKWDLFEYCVYEANFSKKDSSSSIIFYSVANEDKVGYAIWEKGSIVKEGVARVYDNIKMRTADKYTLDNFLFSTDNALIISFLDENKLCLLQNSYQGFAKRYQRDTTYNAQPATPIKLNGAEDAQH